MNLNFFLATIFILINCKAQATTISIQLMKKNKVLGRESDIDPGTMVGHFVPQHRRIRSDNTFATRASSDISNKHQSKKKNYIRENIKNIKNLSVMSSKNKESISQSPCSSKGSNISSRKQSPNSMGKRNFIQENKQKTKDASTSTSTYEETKAQHMKPNSQNAVFRNQTIEKSSSQNLIQEMYQRPTTKDTPEKTRTNMQRELKEKKKLSEKKPFRLTEIVKDLPDNKEFIEKTVVSMETIKNEDKSKQKKKILLKAKPRDTIVLMTKDKNVEIRRGAFWNKNLLQALRLDNQDY